MPLNQQAAEVLNIVKISDVLNPSQPINPILPHLAPC